MRIFLALAISAFIGAFATAKTEPKPITDFEIKDLYPDNPTFLITIPTSPPKTLSSADQNLVMSFSRLLAHARALNITTEMWFREDHFIYIYEKLSNAAKLELNEVFSLIETKLTAGETDFKKILNSVGHSLLIAEVAKIDNVVVGIKDQHKHVIRLAFDKHYLERNQLYGVMPYSYHLREVRGALKRFGFGPKTSLFGLKLGTAAWLHDIIEDTDVSYDNVVSVVGVEIADIVRGVSKIEKLDGMSKEDRTRTTYELTRTIQGSRILKVADRIANVEDGLIRLFLGMPSIVYKYFDEWPLFAQMLFVPGDCDEMWRHLQNLLTDKAYAQKFVMANLHKPRMWDCEAALIKADLEEEP